MKKLIAGFLTALTFLLTVSSPVLAILVSEQCYDANYVLLSYNYTFEGTNSAFNQTAPCANGCSTTLGTCRADEFTQIFQVAGVLFASLIFGAVGMWISAQTHTKTDLVFLILDSIFLLFVGITDVFDMIRFRTIIIGFAFVPLAFIYYSRVISEEEPLVDPQGATEIEVSE